MDAVLCFETRQSYHVLSQEGGVETAPFISLHLLLTDGPRMYASDASLINSSSWSMMIRRCGTVDPSAGALGSIQYVATDGKPRCVIEVHQAPERFAALLDLFRGGHASELTVVLDELLRRPDYSKEWNTAARATMPIKSVSFEFPLPQSEA